MSDFLHSDDEGHVDPDQPMKDFYSQAPDLMVMSQYFVETKDGIEYKTNNTKDMPLSAAESFL